MRSYSDLFLGTLFKTILIYFYKQISSINKVTREHFSKTNFIQLKMRPPKQQSYQQFVGKNSKDIFRGTEWYQI